MTVKIPLGSIYQLNIGKMDGYSQIEPLTFTATEKHREIVLEYTKIPPGIGDFVYSDGTWSYTYQSDKSCMGICFYVNGKDRRMFAIDRPLTGSDGDNIGDFGKYSACWGDNHVEGILSTNDHELAIKDMNGRENTDLILAVKQTDNPHYNNTSDYPAANFCNNFSAGSKGKGSWWLPSYGELYEITKNSEQLYTNSLITGGIPINTAFYWSSTHYNNPSMNLAWASRFIYGENLMGYALYNLMNVLPVTNF